MRLEHENGGSFGDVDDGGGGARRDCVSWDWPRRGWVRSGSGDEGRLLGGGGGGKVAEATSGCWWSSPGRWSGRRWTSSVGAAGGWELVKGLWHCWPIGGRSAGLTRVSVAASQPKLASRWPLLLGSLGRPPVRRGSSPPGPASLTLSVLIHNGNL